MACAISTPVSAPCASVRYRRARQPPCRTTPSWSAAASAAGGAEDCSSASGSTTCAVATLRASSLRGRRSATRAASSARSPSPTTTTRPLSGACLVSTAIASTTRGCGGWSAKSCSAGRDAPIARKIASNSVAEHRAQRLDAHHGRARRELRVRGEDGRALGARARDRESKRRDRAREHAARLVRLVEDRALVAEEGQIVRATHARGAATDDRDALPGARCAGTRGPGSDRRAPHTERASCALVHGSGEGRVAGVEKPLAYASSAAIATGAPNARRLHARLAGRVAAVSAGARERVGAAREQVGARMVARRERARDRSCVHAERAAVVGARHERWKGGGRQRQWIAFCLIAQFASIKFFPIASAPRANYGCRGARAALFPQTADAPARLPELRGERPPGIQPHHPTTDLWEPTNRCRAKSTAASWCAASWDSAMWGCRWPSKWVTRGSKSSDSRFRSASPRS